MSVTVLTAADGSGKALRIKTRGVTESFRIEGMFSGGSGVGNGWEQNIATIRHSETEMTNSVSKRPISPSQMAEASSCVSETLGGDFVKGNNPLHHISPRRSGLQSVPVSEQAQIELNKISAAEKLKMRRERSTTSLQLPPPLPPVQAEKGLDLVQSPPVAVSLADKLKMSKAKVRSSTTPRLEPN